LSFKKSPKPFITYYYRIIINELIDLSVKCSILIPFGSAYAPTLFSSLESVSELFKKKMGVCI
jgi:hypothetical protein